MAYDILYDFSDEKTQTRDQDFKFNVKKNPGMCLGISCDWACNSLKLNGINRRDQLNPARWAIIQSAYLINVRNLVAKPIDQFRAVVENSGLTISNNKGKGALYKANNAGSVARQLRTMTGTCVWALFGPGGSHAMGWRSDPGVVEFVDANYGHVRGDDLDELLDFVSDEIAARYSLNLGHAVYFEVKL